MDIYEDLQAILDFMKGEQRQQGMDFEPLGQILITVLRTVQAEGVGLASEATASPVSAQREGDVQKFVERRLER